jgi:hypothetical protein
MFNYLNLPTLSEAINQIEASVEQTEDSIRFVRHPLYHTIWTHEDMTDLPKGLPEGFPFGREAFIQLITNKLEALSRSAEAGDWSRWLWVFERPYRVEALRMITEAGKLSGRRLAELILDVWQDTEFPHESQQDWEYLFGEVTVQTLNWALGEEEKIARNELPVMVRVYRGAGQWNNVIRYEPDGFSWTLDVDKAHWFARRFNPKGTASYVIGTELPLHELVGPLMNRGEQEMIWLPKRGDA